MPSTCIVLVPHSSNISFTGCGLPLYSVPILSALSTLHAYTEACLAHPQSSAWAATHLHILQHTNDKNVQKRILPSYKYPLPFILRSIGRPEDPEQCICLNHVIVKSVLEGASTAQLFAGGDPHNGGAWMLIRLSINNVHETQDIMRFSYVFCLARSKVLRRYDEEGECHGEEGESLGCSCLSEILGCWSI